jgi:hypothetical protein
MSIRYLRRGRHSAVCIITAATLRATAAAEANVNSDIHMARSLLLVPPQSPIERAVNAGPIIPFLELRRIFDGKLLPHGFRGIRASRYIPGRDGVTAGMVAYF